MIPSKIFIVLLAVLLTITILSWCGGYPVEVENTLTACDWCESNCSKYYEYCPHCFGGMSCDACVDYYRNHFNLTQETFPCYCWDSDETMPTKLEWFFIQRRK